MPALPFSELESRARALRVLLFDVDGVLTDGGVYLVADRREIKRFSIKDGAGISAASKCGLITGILSARASAATNARAAELGMKIVLQGVTSKRQAFSDLLASHNVTAAEVAYMGDDLVDLAVLTQAGLSGCPSDAAAEVVVASHWTSRYGGGQGAAREFIEVILKARGQWDDVLLAHA
jgi:3-deoxy-D-manno-octulosonate 8-phosphate phosphatase (KDO 8-P phosphatase)